MRRKPYLLLLLTLSLLLPSLWIWTQSGGSALLRGAGSAVAQESTMPAAWRKANELFQQQRYREALDQLSRLGDGAVAGVDPRERAWLEASARLRLAGVQNDDQPRRESILALLTLIERSDDDWSARAVRELIRAGAHEAQQHLPRTLTRWEQSSEVEPATADYLELLDVILSSEHGSSVSSQIVLRMWENLVRVKAKPERLHELGSRILSGRPGPAPRSDRRSYAWPGGPGWRPNGGDPEALVRTVSRDLLRLEPPLWLAADAHYQLGLVALRAAKNRQAVHHLETVLALVSEKDSWAAHEARQNLDRLRRPSLSLGGVQLYRPGSPHELQLGWRNVGGWDLVLRRISVVEHARIPDTTDDQGRDLASLFAPDAGEVVIERGETDNLEMQSRRVVEPLGEPHLERSKLIRFEALERGVYVATLTPRVLPGVDRPSPQRHVIVVSALGITASPIVDARSGEEVLELWAVSMESGKVLENLDLRMFSRVRRGQERSWIEQDLRTDRDGLARTRSYSKGDTEWGVVFAEHEGQPLVAALSSMWWASLSLDSEMRGFVWSDRPLYRPNETVHLQGFVRWMDHARRNVKIPEGERRFRLLVNSPDGQTFDDREVVLDANGSIEIGLELPRRPALGAYSVQLRSLREQRWAVYGTFQVDEYRLPEFTVSVELDDAQRYVLGDTLEIDLTAEYLFGGPVEGLAEIVVTRSPVWVFWRPWKRYAWDDDGSGMHGPYPGGRVANPWYGGSQEEVLRVTALLGENGRARIQIPTDDRESQQRDWDYRVEARVADLSRREETGSTNVRVTQQELYAFLYSERSLVAPGDQARIRIRIQDALGRGVAHEGRWSLHVHDDKRDRTLLEKSVATDAAGEGFIEFVPDRPGYYTVRYKSQDERGNDLAAETVVWCADPRTRDISHATGALSLVVEQEEILGDTARVLLVTDTPGLPIYLTRTHAGGTETQVLRPKGTAQLLEIPVDALHRPWFQMRAVTARDYRLHEASARVIMPETPRLLDVTLTFDEEEYLPGSLAPLRVKVADADGEPVQTWLSFAVVDGAVLALKPRELPDLVQLFHGYRTRPLPALLPGQAMLGGYRWLEDESEEDEGKWRDGNKGFGAMLDEDGIGGRFERAAAQSVVAEAAMPMAKMAADAPPESRTPDADLDVTLRADFRTTVFWRTAVQTDADGTASVDVPLAESLTRWNARVVALDPRTRVGTAETTARTRKPFMVRLNHPRVFRERDAFTLAATVHNDREDDVEALVQLRAEGLEVGSRTQRVLVPAGGQTRVEWEARVPDGAAELTLQRDSEGRVLRALPDEIVVTVAAEGTVDSDGLQRTVQLLPYGSPLRIAASTQVRDGGGSLSFALPDDRTAGSTLATLAVSPSVLSSCVQALPYLAQYPYGCTEQTLSRFVPAAAVAAVAEAFGVDPARFDPELDAKIEDGLARIADLQLPSGAWGWWREGGEDPYMTSYALVALSTARENGVDVSSRMIQRGRDALRSLLPRLETREDDMAYALYALTRAETALGRRTDVLSQDETFARHLGRLFDDRDDLRAYARALVATVLHRVGDTERATLMLRHLENDVRLDDVVDTAHWGRSNGYWWRGDGAVEATSFAVLAFGAIEPASELREAAVRWLIANRRGHRWDSTRSTAHAIYALVEVARERGDAGASGTLIARIGTTEVARVEWTPESILDGPLTVMLPTDQLRDGSNTLTLDLRGEGEPFVTFEANTYSRDESVEPAGHWLEITREIVRLEPRRTLGGTVLQIEHQMREGDAIASGDRLRVRLHITARQDVEYVAIEDPRAAGTEPVDRLSGWHVGQGMSGRREVRDELTGFFMGVIPEGQHELVYDLRAESPGSFHVAPARAWGMYLPDVTGHSANDRVQVLAGEDAGLGGGSGR